MLWYRTGFTDARKNYFFCFYKVYWCQKTVYFDRSPCLKHHTDPQRVLRKCRPISPNFGVTTPSFLTPIKWLKWSSKSVFGRFFSQEEGGQLQGLDQMFCSLGLDHLVNHGQRISHVNICERAWQKALCTKSGLKCCAEYRKGPIWIRSMPSKNFFLFDYKKILPN